MLFFTELKRRNVIRVAVAYLMLSWLVLQVADVLVQGLELPAVWPKAVIALLALGFIPVLVFSWIYEMTPEGLKRESEVAPDQSITVHTAKKLDVAVIALLVLAGGLYGYVNLVADLILAALTFELVDHQNAVGRREDRQPFDRVLGDAHLVTHFVQLDR